MVNTRRVLVIGLDGASPLLVDQWIDELPTFQRFRENGLWGWSIPSIPAQTPVAWTTFMTGKNPGKHGIFSFVQRKTGSYERRIADPTVVKSENLWQILSEYGERVGVINVPMSSYKRINGFMIPGFLDAQEGIPQPEAIRERVKKLFNLSSIPGDVETEILSRVKEDPTILIDRIFEITELLRDVSLHLMETELWDFFMVVFMGTDRISHFFWKYVDPNHIEYTENEFSLRVKNYYKMVDDTISKLLKVISEDTLTMLVSDHGFCPVSREIFLNNYLQEYGFLETNNAQVNVKRSSAVAYGYGDIWLNIKGREPAGIIETREYERVRNDIIDCLQEVRIEGEKPIQRVVKREEVYWGPYVAEASDLIAIFNTGWQAARRPAIIEKRNDGNYYNNEPLWCGGHDGTHDPKEVPGILGFMGPRLKKGDGLLRAHLWDLSPTLLKIMKIPIPQDMDGKALNIFITDNRDSRY